MSKVFLTEKQLMAAQAVYVTGYKQGKIDGRIEAWQEAKKEIEKIEAMAKALREGAR